MRFSFCLIGILSAVPVFADAVVTPQKTQENQEVVTSVSTPTATAPVFGTKAYIKQVFLQKTPKIELQAPVRLQDFIVGEKLELSLRNYLDAVLANNTEIAVQRLTIETPRNAILRQYSIFDPTIVGNWSTTRAEAPITNSLEGVPITSASSQLSQPLSLRLQQLMPTGTSFTVTGTGNKAVSNSGNNFFNPSINTGLNFTLAQPLLRGRGMYMTRLPITIARSRLRASEYQIRDQILRLIQTAENAYWNVVSARENLAVQEQSLALFDQSLKRSQRELELGAISQLEIYQPQAQFANAQIAVTQARFALEAAEDVLRRQMGADLDPNLRTVPIVLTEQVAPPIQTTLEKEPLVERAIRQRPDLQVVRQNLDVDDLNLQSAKNNLRPLFNLTGTYASAGRGGIMRLRDQAPIPGGIGDSLSQLFGFGFPTYGFGVQLNLPIRNRAASADLADALVTKRLDMLRLRAQEQTARLEVLNAITQVEQSKASVELAKVALDLAQKRLEAEQKKFDLGVLEMFFVLDAQTALARAQSALVDQTINYRRNLTTLHRVTGDLFTERGISVP